MSTAACPQWHYLPRARDDRFNRERYDCPRLMTHTTQAAAYRMRQCEPGTVVIVGSRRRLGKSPIAGWGSTGVGYTMACSCGEWVLRVNANKRESSTYARDHLREAHGLRGRTATDALRF